MKKALFFLMTLMALSLSWGGAVKAQETLTVYDETTGTLTSNQYVPMYGNYFDNYTKCEFVIPANQLENMVGGEISALKFYIQTVGTYGTGWSSNQQVFLKEVESTSLSAWSGTYDATIVWEGSFTTPAPNATEFEITFTTPYVYQGGNLLVGIYNTTKGGYRDVKWYGRSVSGASGGNNSSSDLSSVIFSQKNFIPKTTFTYEPGTPSTCEKPATLNHSNVTATSATLTWTGGSGTYNLEVKGGSYTDWTSVLSNTSLTTTTLSPLNPETQYQIRVQSVCGEEVSGWKTASFPTPCGTITTFPKTYTFETSDGFPSNASTPTTNQLGNCWRNEATVQNGSYSTRVWGTSTTNKKIGSQSLVLPDKGNNTNPAKTMLVFPAMDFTSANGYVVSFWIYRNTSGSSSSPEGFKVYASDCDTIGANAVDLGFYSRYYNIAYPQIESTSGWYYYETAPITMTGTVYIIFEGQSYYQSETYVDDVTIKVAPSCFKPTGLEANNITTQSADLSWTDHGETAWTLYYKKTSDENYTEVSNVNENPYTLPDLDHSSNYQFYVVANCSATDNSEASDVKTFITECEAISAVDYSANFDDYTAGNNVLPLCWRPINTTTNSSYTGYPKIYNYNANSPSNCLYLYSYAYYSGGSTTSDPQPQYAILPEMTDLGGKQITLQARGYNTSSTFKVGTMSDPTDASTFTEITGSPDNPAAITTSYQEYIFYIPSNTTDRYVAIMIEAANSSRTTNGVYIDDIVFSVAPTCWRTQNLAASNVTNESATLTWQRHAMGEETAWVLQYGTDENFGDGTYTEVTPSTNPTYTIENGLAATTTYYVRVKPACDNNGNLWSDTISFETEASCMIPNSLVISDVTAHGAFLTWNGNNDSYNLRYRKATTAPVFFNETYDFEDNSLQGWTTISNDNDNNAWTIQSGSSDAHQSYYYARSRYTSSGDGVANDWLISPQIPLGGTFSFYAKRYNTSYTDQFQVYVSTTGTEISDFTAISEVVTPNATYDPYEYDLSAYSGYGYVAIVYTAPNNQYHVYVDDIHITATIPGVFDEWQTVNNATKPYPFSDLDAETYYEAQVNGYCNSSSTTTDWSNPISFTTAIACPAPTNLAYSNVAAHTVDLTWNVNGNPTTNYVLTKNDVESNIVVTINEGVASYTLANLNGETAYTVKVKANCGELDGYSLVSNSVTFTTQVSCAIPTGLAAIDEETTSIKLHWTPNSGETAWVVAHKIDGADQFTEVPVAQSDLDGDGNYNLTGLADGKTYTIKVRANCGVTDGLSQWSSEITHATAASCTTPTNLTVSDVNGHGATIGWTDAPVVGKNYIVMVASENMALNVDFENNSIPSNFTNDANYPWYVYTGTDCTSKAMRSGNYHVSNSSSAIEVTVNVTEASTLSFDFWSRGEGTDNYDWDNGRFYIDGTMKFRYGKHDSWESYSTPIEAGNHTLKWEYKKDGVTDEEGDCFYVDNIKITAGASAFVEKDPTTATSLELNDLDPETTYYVKVKGDCGSATSPESGVETFTTPAACNAPTSLTYDDESVTAHTVDLSWTENNGATAWKVIYSKVNIDNSEITVDIDENDVTISGTTITYTLTGLDGQTDYIARVKSNCGGVHNDISAESNSTSFTTLTACYPVGDVITSDITAYTVTVQWTDANNVGAYVIKQGDNVLDGTTTPSVVINDHTAIISGLEPEHTYTYGTFKVFADCGTEGMSTGTNVPYFQTEPSCHPVTNVNITGKTPNSVTFTWEDTYTPDTYIIKEGENVLTGETAHSVVIDATNHTATISGLDEKVTYSAGTFKVFADCGTTDGQSAGVNVPAFTTPCNPQSITYTMGFETDEVDKFGCWEVISGNIGIKSGTAHGGSSYRLDLRGTTSNMIALPQFTEPTNTLRVELYTRPESTNSNCGKFSIGYLTDPNDASTFQGIDTVSVSEWSGTVAYEFMRVDFNKTDVPADARIVLRQFDCATNYYWYVDDITVKLIPSCDVVSGLTVGEKSANRVALSWTPGASQETNWKLQYRVDGTEDWNTRDVAESDLINGAYTLDQLTAETTYNWQVAADCGNNGISDYTAGVDFTTLESCPAPTALTLTTGSETPNGATITWTAGSIDNEHFILEYRIVGDEDWIEIQTQNYIEETTYTINTLDPETSYQVRVSAVCGTELSGYSNVENFTTTEACPKPAAVTASNVTANGATISWNGTSDSYTVSYRTAENMNVLWSEGFEDESTFTNWTRSNTSNVSRSTSAKYSDNYGVQFTYTSNPPLYLISPDVSAYTTESGLKLEFYYSNNSNSYTETFYVGFSNTNTEYESFDFGTTEYSITNQEWKRYFEDIPTGTKYIAIKYTGNDTYNMYVDDFVIGTTIPAGGWQTVNTAETSTTLTDLTPETTYEAKVQGHCANDDSGESELISFTPSCSFYQLLTDASDLAAGDKIIIAAATYDKAMSTTQNTSNHYRGITDIIKNGNRLGTPSSTVQVLTLEEGTTTGTWALNTGNGYLKATSSSSNYLDTQDDITDNASWTITVGESIASIVANGTYTNNTMRYNNSSTRISCYSPTNSQYDLAIYKLTDYRGKGPDTTHTGVVATMGDSYECMGQTFTASGDYEVLVGTSTNGCDSIRILHLTLMEQVKTPTFSPAEGEYNLAQNVEISCETADATIYYTTDGTVPTAASAVYSQAITVEAGTTVTIKAIAMKEGMGNSEVATATYTVTNQEHTITFNAGTGTCTTESMTAVSIDDLPTATLSETCVQQGWVFYGWSESAVANETTDVPALVSTPYAPTNDITLYAVYSKGESQETEFNFETIATANNWTNGIQYSSVTIDPVTLTATGGGNDGKYYSSDNTWRIYSSSNGTVTITSTGGTVTAVSSNPSKEFTINNNGVASYTASVNTNFKSITVTTGSSIYYSNPVCLETVATPTFNLAEGSYSGAQSVEISCATEDATIYYTLDGTEPSTSSTEYTGAIAINETSTLKAIAVKDGMNNSAVAIASYTIVPIYTVTLDAGNGSLNIPSNTMEGNSLNPIDLSNVTATLDNCEGWNFAGWSTSSVSETTTAPTTFVEELYYPTADVTLYAVYQQTEQSGQVIPARYVKVTSDQNDWSGDYLIVCENANKAFNGNLTTLDASNNNIAVTIDNGIIESNTTTDAAKFIIAKLNTTTGYSIKSASGYYIGSTSNSKNELLSSTSTQYSNTISVNSGNASIQGTSRYLRYNNANNDQRFRYYTSSSQQDIQLYKYEDGTAPATTTYNSNPVCVTLYTITATADPTEGGTVSGAGTYDDGTEITLTATANEGYTFVNWTKGGELVSLTPTCTLTVTEDAAYVANFVVNSYNITVNISPSVGGTVTGADSYVYGSTATLTATANTGYHFVNWTKDDVQVSTDAEYSFTVTGDATYVANFELNNYDITVSANPTEGGTVSGEGNFNYGDNVILTATANTGYTFVNWTKGGESVSTNPTCTLAVTGAAAYVANFELNSYDITVSANPTAGGTVSGGDTYNHGATVTLTATANEGYTFTNWTKSGEEVSTESTYSFAAEAAGDYVANFTLNSYEITATANPAAGGTVTGAGTYSHGANVTLTAMANEGYTFTNWTKSGEEVSTQSTYSFAAAAAGDYVANFTLNSYEITVSADPTEGGTVSGAGNYNHGADVTLTATANEGYTFVNWTKGGESVSTNPTCTLAVTGAAAYVAHFSLNSYAVTATVNPAEGGSVTGAGTYSHGANVTLTAIANNGYHFVNWTENDAEVSTDASYSFTFTGARNLVANFAITPAGLSWSAQDFTGYTMIDFNNWKPTVNNPNNVSLRYGCVEGNNIDQGGIMVDATTGVIGMAAAYGHIHSTSGTFHIYAVHETDETAYYDSIVYTLNVLPSAMVLLTKNIDEGGSVSMPDATDVPTLTHHYTTLAGTPTAFVAQGQDLNILAESATGYHFTGWTLSNEPLATTADYTYHVPDAITGTSVLITDIKAVFDTNTYTLTVLSDDVIMGSANGSTTAKHFLSYEISATPNTGYHFTQWSDGNTQNPRTVTLTENTTYTAEFAVNSYAITTGVLPANSGSVTGAGTYNHFDNATLTATATTGYTFTNWTENGVVVNATNPYEFQVTGERELVANFSLNTYAVSASANPAAGGTVTGAGTYDHGTNVTVTATANDGYAFVNWTEGGQEVSTNASYSFTFTEGRTLVANFTPIIYTVTFNPGTGSCQTASRTGSIESSINIDAVTATPYTICGDQGWEFAGWSTASVGETSQAPAFVSGTEYIPTDNITLYAVYKKTVDGEPTSSTPFIDFSEQGYTNGQAVSSASIGNNITVNFFKGTNNNAPKYYTTGAAIRCYGGNYFTVSTDNGTPITNIALTFGSGEDNNTISTDNGDYSNGTWTGNENSVKFTISGTSNHRRIARISVTTSVPTTSAIYNSNPLCYVYAVNVDQNIEHGSVVADQTTDIVAGTEITLTPTPETGYHFGIWNVTAGNDPVTVENNKFTMPESDVIVSALFWIDTLTVNVNANPAAGGTVSGAGDYEYGDMVTLIATANTGYTFVNWTENNQEVSTDATYEFTFNGAAGTRTFVANFSLNSYEITVSANPTEGGNVNGGNTYNHGATANLTATPSTGYHFVNWTKEGVVVSTDANYSFTVAEAGAYVANFALNSYTIAATANPTAGGAVSGAGTYNHFDNVTLTATVVNGYDFDGWYNGNDQVATSLEYSFVATGDVTLEARFAKRYTITFVPGSHSSSTIEPRQGSSVTAVNIDAVTADPSTLCVAQDWVFAGWSSQAIAETTVAPTTWVSGTAYYPTSDITLYAVYTKTEGAGSNTASIDFSDQGYTNAQDVTDVAISNNVNVTFSKGTSNNAPKYYSSGSAIRCYGGNTFTVTATEASITNITLTFGSEDGSNYISPDNGDYSNGTWTGNENSVTFTIDGTSGNRRIAGMSVTTFSGTVTYNSNPECFVYDVVVNPNEHGTITADPNTGVIAGTEITLTNTPSEGYHFAGWTVTAGNDPVTVENNKFFMPESDVNVSATFEPDTFTLTVNYIVEGGGTAPEAYSARLPFGTPYSVVTPVITGLTPSQEVVSGTMPADDVTVDVTYYTDVYTLTVHYVYADNTPAAEDEVRNLAYNVPYTVTSPTIEGYTPDQVEVSGTMGEDNVEVTVVYSINSHNLTINYVNEDASAQVAESHTATLNYHDNYSVTSPQVAGYAANKSVVSGTMGDADKTETVTYYQVQTNIVDATNCAGTGTGSLTVTAPTGNFEYSLDGVTFQTETQFANLNAGDYTLYIRPTGEDYNYSGVWTVNSNITMPVAEASVNPFYCLGDEINLSGNGSSTGSEYTYAWSGPNNFTATDINATIAAAEDIHSGSYTLTVTNTVTNCVSDTTVEVIVNTPNMNGYLFTIATHCDAYANLVGGQATPVFATPTVQHYLADAGCTVNVNNDAQATYEEAGDYTITWTATDACGNTATTTQVLHIVLGTCPVAADVDGNTYPVVALNNICWMAANLRTTHYSDGRLIPNPMVYTSVMYPDATANLDMFGYLYDWTAAMDAANGLVQDANGNVQGICPDGWRMPKENEIRALVNDGVSDIFDLRTTDQWLNNFGTNTTGFSLLPAGCYNANSDRFENLHGDAYIWGVGASAPAQPRVFWADCKCYNWQILDTTTPMGYSVRCVRNN